MRAWTEPGYVAWVSAHMHVKPLGQLGGGSSCVFVFWGRNLRVLGTRILPRPSGRHILQLRRIEHILFHSF